MGKIASVEEVSKYIDKMIGSFLHKKQVCSLTMTLFGALHSVRHNITSIGRAMAIGRGALPKHAIKLVDRLIGNDSLQWNNILNAMVRNVVGSRRRIIISIDWTEYGYVAHSRLAINLITRHGRATPLLWKTFLDSKLYRRRSEYERRLLQELYEILDDGVTVTVLADRGFESVKLFDFIENGLGWDYIIRLRKNTLVLMKNGRYVYSSSLVPSGGRELGMREVILTGKHYLVKTVAFVKAKAMKESWVLASSLNWTVNNIIKMYGRRFTCEEQFRDEKDARFGSGTKDVLVGSAKRRDRLLLIHMLATIFLTLLGAAGERIGYAKMLRANTVKYRTHSLYRQGKEYFKGIVHRYEAELCHVFWCLVNEMTSCYVKFAII